MTTRISNHIPTFESHLPDGPIANTDDLLRRLGLAYSAAEGRRLTGLGIVDVIHPDGQRETASADLSPDVQVGDVIRVGRRRVRLVEPNAQIAEEPICIGCGEFIALGCLCYGWAR